MTVRSNKGITHVLSLKHIELGQHFKVHWYSKGISRHVKLIKVTNKGYNLLDIKSNECILYPHLYPHKSSDISGSKLIFYINDNLNLTKIRSES